MSLKDVLGQAVDGFLGHPKAGEKAAFLEVYRRHNGGEASAQQSVSGGSQVGGVTANAAHHRVVEAPN